MKLTLLGDSVFDNRNYVKSDDECVKSVINNAGINCELLAVDGEIIEFMDSQLDKLKKSSDTTNIVLSVGGNNALGSLHLILDKMDKPVEDLLFILEDFIEEFETKLKNLYSNLSEIAGARPVLVVNIYNPCFEFSNRVIVFDNMKELGYDKKILKIIEKLNSIIQKLAKKNHFGYIDINSEFNSKKFYANEIEPSFEGSKLLCKLIHKELNKKNI